MTHEHGLESSAEPTSSCRDFGYDACDAWAQLPAGYTWTEVSAVAIDSQDRVFVFNRGEHAVIVFAPDGTFLRSWGERLFARPHGIFIGPDDAVYTTDDLDHTVHGFTPDGKLLFTLPAPVGMPRPTRARRSSTSARSRTPAGRFIFPRILAARSPAARFTSPMATATPAYTSSRRTDDCSSRGASPEADRASFTCRTALRSTPRGLFMSPTARIAAYSCSRPPATISTSGPASPDLARCSSIAPAGCTWRSSAFAPACGLAPSLPAQRNRRTSEHFQFAGQTARARWGGARPVRSRRLLRTTRHLRRLARRYLSGRSRNVSRRQPRPRIP